MLQLKIKATGKRKGFNHSLHTAMLTFWLPALYQLDTGIIYIYVSIENLTATHVSEPDDFHHNSRP